MDEKTRSFYGGALAVLDVIYSFDDDATAVLPVAVVRTMNDRELVRAAKNEEYHNLDLLKKTVKEARRHLAT